jgi:hypothetical protein
MPFRSLIHDANFDPEAIEAMSAAYDCACSALDLVGRSDPLTTTVAKKIVEAASRGERDPIMICRDVLISLGRPNEVCRPIAPGGRN